MPAHALSVEISFNRRGDSLGGAARDFWRRQRDKGVVSIAGAILWGVLPISLSVMTAEGCVSIAGAILWGVLRVSPYLQNGGNGVSIAGAILWGVLRHLTRQ